MKIANPTPAYCSCCHNQQVGMTHIDFECYYDGPVIDPGNGIKQVIDDLYLCENCVRAAGEMIGMTQNEKALAELKKLRAERLDLNNELRALRERMSSISEAVAA